MVIARKHPKLKRALRLGFSGRNGTNSLSPRPGEQPIVYLRVQVAAANDLIAKDKNGLSDPYVIVTLQRTRQHTSVAKKTLNPVFKDATWDFPIYLSTADTLGALELVLWDKDVIRKDYLGEACLPVDNWFDTRPKSWDDPGNVPFTVPLVSTRLGTPAQGTIRLRVGFVAPPPPTARAPNQAAIDFDALYRNLVKTGRSSLVSAPPTEGVGTLRSHLTGPEFEDDGGLSSASESSSSDEEDALSECDFEDEAASPETPVIPPSTSRLQALYQPPTTLSPPTPSPDPVANVKTPTGPSPMTTPTPSSALNTTDSTPSPPSDSTPGDKKSRPSFIALPNPRKFLTRSRPPTPGEDPTSKEKRKMFRRSWSGTGTPGDESKESKNTENQKGKPRRRPKPQRAYSLGPEAANGHPNDIVGIVMLEIAGASDLPRLKNMTRTSFDMDPFVVISFWEEGFPDPRNSTLTESCVRLSVLDWDKLSSNDYIGEALFNVSELVADAPQPLPASSPVDIPLYPESEGGNHPMKNFKLKLEIGNGNGGGAVWETRHSPVITFRAKYQPYSLLRQRFWRQYLQQYDADDTATLSHVEITSMLDSLGSTLSPSTIDGFFTRFGKDPRQEDLTMEEAIICLELEVCRPENERKRVDDGNGGLNIGSGLGTSINPTPAPGSGAELKLAELDFAGPALDIDFVTGEAKGYVTEPSEMALLHPISSDSSPRLEPPHSRQPTSESSSDADLEEESSSSSLSASQSAPSTPVVIASSPTVPAVAPPATNKKSRFRRPRYRKAQSSVTTASQIASVSSPTSTGSEESFERLINIKNCPLCHRPRLTSKAELDIITHIAVCASQDWSTVDRIVVGNFVTASQAQRKWYTKVIGKISSGDYRLGANSANIIVQNRLTGQLEEEKMQVYVRLGIRLLYKGMKSRMEGGRARRLLKSMSIKQGLKYDSPVSARDIPAFIEFHQLNINEIRDPLSSYKTFNQFFYRKLKPDARPVETPDDPYRLVSAADCRFMAFESVTEATRLWIKGREFTVARLLGDAYKHEAERYNNGALAIFRLAPQDYHRFHSPVDGTIGNMTYIAGEYYTVNPQAIRTALDVYGENARKIVPIDSPQFGRVMAVCVGAMMVGSIETTVKEGEAVKRGQEFGYFAFGGSTIVVLFEKGVLEWDEDLLVNGRASLETLVRVGMGIGRGSRKLRGSA
ncbi:Phosphatidylserine decarboxylase proenzyme 2 [Mycena indigotica]|uniref:Phosphatidylserine decarboxylase proenzyme 2 n=1 Tax=Mycena indigotica TaxID=2126181 RepID=A0A8H6W182_9AGAR|nr:Phosphatidylserine decarboxylase proenzyme 2 [Mycena indigotica]KAF7299266.1 Phosphatidylserine decarboxylase proenzyme 2 [Mycena indigotica]